MLDEFLYKTQAYKYITSNLTIQRNFPFILQQIVASFFHAVQEELCGYGKIQFIII